MSAQALRAGALAVVPRPLPNGSAAPPRADAYFLSTVKAMAQVKVVRRWRDHNEILQPPERLERPLELGSAAAPQRPMRLVAIAASTGGPAALECILSQLPANFPAPVLVVQHIAKGFVSSLAEHLNLTCRLHVKLAESGELLLRGTVYIAPDDKHLSVTPAGTIELSSDYPVAGFRPSADCLFESTAGYARGPTVHVILTGMGEDGVEGLREARARAGAWVIAQDEASCVVFGMPRSAIEAQVVDEVLPLPAIAARLMALVQGV
jgi:two-component system chemotaxis response regulator CheB